ncbi:MAG: hypothetical protein NZ777_00545, partial [Pseudomonadales bacterium]|nr:hypothetical protein [Pseudomonadales bacterium]
RVSRAIPDHLIPDPRYLKRGHTKRADSKACPLIIGSCPGYQVLRLRPMPTFLNKFDTLDITPDR